LRKGFSGYALVFHKTFRIDKQSTGFWNFNCFWFKFGVAVYTQSLIVLDGVYEKKSTGRLKFYPAQAPSNETIQNLVGSIASRINNLLIRKKYLEKVEYMVLVGNTDEIINESGQHSHEDVHLPARAASVTHRIAFVPNTGQPVRRLKSQMSLWPPEQHFKSTSTACVLAGGYSVHAETAIKTHERERLEKPVRYMSACESLAASEIFA
jgi:hypothetical protein